MTKTLYVNSLVRRVVPSSARVLNRRSLISGKFRKPPNIIRTLLNGSAASINAKTKGPCMQSALLDVPGFNKPFKLITLNEGTSIYPLNTNPSFDPLYPGIAIDRTIDFIQQPSMSGRVVGLLGGMYFAHKYGGVQSEYWMSADFNPLGSEENYNFNGGRVDENGEKITFDYESTLREGIYFDQNNKLKLLDQFNPDWRNEIKRQGAKAYFVGFQRAGADERTERRSVLLFDDQGNHLAILQTPEIKSSKLQSLISTIVPKAKTFIEADASDYVISGSFTNSGKGVLDHLSNIPPGLTTAMVLLAVSDKPNYYHQLTPEQIELLKQKLSKGSTNALMQEYLRELFKVLSGKKKLPSIHAVQFALTMLAKSSINGFTSLIKK
jgi:hypothetical protein